MVQTRAFRSSIRLKVKSSFNWLSRLDVITVFTFLLENFHDDNHCKIKTKDHEVGINPTFTITCF